MEHTPRFCLYIGSGWDCIIWTERFSTQEVIDGVYNAFNYNSELKAMCVMIESNEYKVISREYFLRGTYINEIKKWLE